MKIEGIIPALVTPFREDYSVDYEALEQLVERLIGQGIGGFYACGSTAECFLLTEEERKKILETVVRQVNGRVPVIAHIGDIGTQKSVELARHAESVGASAVSSTPPFYFKFSTDEIAGYYADISKAVELPLILYNIPALSGVELSVQSLGVLLNSCRVLGLKYTSYNLFELERIHRAYPALKLYNGHDELYCNALPIGITGAIGSTFNVMAGKYLAIRQDYEAGAMQAASKRQSEVNALIDVLIQTGVNAGIKYLLTRSGISCGDSRPPFRPLTAAQRGQLDEIYEAVFR